MSTNPYKQSFANGGWICAQCGQWVPDGTLHNCLKNKPSETYNAAPLGGVEFLLYRILEVLTVIQQDIEILRKKEEQ